jgi:hypothetical protein
MLSSCFQDQSEFASEAGMVISLDQRIKRGSTYVPDRKRNTMLFSIHISIRPWLSSIRPAHVHEGMWESDFGAIDCAVTSGFYHSEDVCVCWIEEYLVGDILNQVSRSP